MDIQKFRQHPVCHDIKNGKLSHSLILISPDSYALEQFSKNLVMALMCESENKPCGECEGCKKVMHNNNVDVLYYPRSNKTVNSAEIEDLITNVYTAPYEADKKVFVINNANNIDAIQQNKLLKTLEEPPHNTYFILIATDTSNILQTIKSRCRQVVVPNFTGSEILQVLEKNGVAPDTARTVLNYCDKSCSQALKYALNENFSEIVGLVESLFRDFRKSWQMLDFASKLYNYNENFEEVLDVYLNICARALAVLIGGEGDKIAKLVAQEFSLDAIINLNDVVLKIVEERKRNCNFNSIVDGFLFKILEVRHKWPVL